MEILTARATAAAAARGTAHVAAWVKDAMRAARACTPRLYLDLGAPRALQVYLMSARAGAALLGGAIPWAQVPQLAGA